MPSVKNTHQKGRFSDTSRFFVMNELKSVRFVADDEIRALETFYHQVLYNLVDAKKKGNKPQRQNRDKANGRAPSFGKGGRN